MPDFSALTDKQRKIYDFICEYSAAQGYPPTVRDIGEAFEIKSPNGVMCHLNALVKKGLITRTNKKARALQPVDVPRPAVPLRPRPAEPAAELPLLGKVAAGSPIAVETLPDRLNLGDLFAGPNHFALRVRGQSMIEDHIDDGDFVIIRSQQTAENGDRVVAMVDGECTLKRFHHEKGKIRLDPANGSMRPIYVDPSDDPQILGILVGVLRKC
jgi:repressor LexA